MFMWSFRPTLAIVEMTCSTEGTMTRALTEDRTAGASLPPLSDCLALGPRISFVKIYNISLSGCATNALAWVAASMQVRVYCAGPIVRPTSSASVPHDSRSKLFG